MEPVMNTLMKSSLVLALVTLTACGRDANDRQLKASESSTPRQQGADVEKAQPLAGMIDGKEFKMGHALAAIDEKDPSRIYVFVKDTKDPGTFECDEEYGIVNVNANEEEAMKSWDGLLLNLPTTPGSVTVDAYSNLGVNFFSATKPGENSGGETVWADAGTIEVTSVTATKVTGYVKASYLSAQLETNISGAFAFDLCPAKKQ
jgi:hypothetical protein